MSQAINSTRDTSTSDEIDLAKLFGQLIDGRWLILSITTLFAIAGIALALLLTPIYKADALVQVEQKSNGGMSALVGDMGEMFASESSSTTEIEIIKSRMILGDTVDALNLTTIASPQYMPIIGKGLSRLMGEEKAIKVSRFDIPRYVDKPNFTLVLDNAEQGTYTLLDEQERKILTGKVGVLAEQNDYRVFVMQLEGNTGDVFDVSKISRFDAILNLQQNLSISEKGKKSGVLQFSLEGENKAQIEAIINDISQNYFLQNIARNSAEAEQSLEFLQAQLPAIKDKLTTSENVLNDFRLERKSVDLSLEARSALDVLVKLEAQLNELTFKESEISQRFTKDHPAYKSLIDKRKVLLAEKERLNGQVQKLPKTQREVLRMQRDVELNQEIYIQLLNKTQELNIVKAGTVGNVRILDTAQAYTHAVKPKKPLIVVLATLLGGMLSVAIVLLKAAFHRGVENPDEIEALGIPVYASIPKSTWQEKLDIRYNKKKVKHLETLLAESNPADLSIEALRGLRTSMHFAMMEAKNNVVMITGPAPNIGKSFVAVNFAAVIAKTGQKVLVVDADMRKGYMQRYFGMKWDNGLSDYLSGKLSLEESIQKSEVPNLDVMTRGQVPPNPSELLMTKRFSDFIDWASANYDLVLIDTPPVLAVTDPSIVGALAGTTLMVGRFDQTSVKEIDVARHRFEQAGIEVKGFILNAVEKKASSTYGYGYYNYSYDSDKK
ncbi:polysaccharide biosynthesis tyrosine autokinase [Aliivibrio fischeri]|uniref:Polysaccharide biosynthesis tyrosine autokinase n=1 Tax=Aliivibrio fischeri TaxID=668 RepID=A0A6N3Z419_ALIFS|nr:polysaccharide biosynthesis tyrosine autokinase [Aliivibrio fischeri]MUK46114.1 polysaccharide biosynthesis tyrosine autokinase [Aliivibrio fischeri]MUK79248.1 polysaccharide biosynthesis tyrosine autokinase [Aliivibrio fischeri]MUK85890.1 polysaccharide biosynthesis tyrosine autokinase [Aliivibrio fischeri]